MLSREKRHAEKVAIEFEEVKSLKGVTYVRISMAILLYIKKKLYKSTARLLHNIIWP